MIKTNGETPRAHLQKIAHRVMLERGLAPDFSATALTQLAAIHAPAVPEPATRDLRGLNWCSIDNDDSRDLDQLSVAEALSDGKTKLLVAIADVAALVPPHSPLDEHAQQNTTSVYTAGAIFPMLPEKLSTDLTSLNLEADRLAVVIEMIVAESGAVEGSEIYGALVKNRAKLAYDSVAGWLDGSKPIPPAVAAVPGLEENIRLQLRTAAQLKVLRHARGALDFETVETRPVFVDGNLEDLTAVKKNPAKDMIEDIMIAANSATATYLAAKNFPSIRRVVREPKRWDRIRELAAMRGTTLPSRPDAKALEQFLTVAKAAEPQNFSDLSLSVIKLMGAGEYAVEVPGGPALGHFGLAVKDYAHATAPNRRFPDLITHRLLKAAAVGRISPYSNDELEELAKHCTAQEDAAKKVERQVIKSSAAMLLASRIGGQFDGLVTGASPKGTWVRLIHPLVEGKLVRGFEGHQVGDRLRVRLIHTDVERGLIDFVAV